MADDARFSCRPRRRSWFSPLTTEVVDAANGEVVAVARKSAVPLIADVLERAGAGEPWETPPYRLYHANRHLALRRPRAEAASAQVGGDREALYPCSSEL